MLLRLKLEIDVEDLRKMLRIKHPQLDEELVSLKEACLIDLAMCGVRQIPEEDPLATAGIRLYLRWQENHNGEAERYKQAYEAVKIAMSLAEEYGEIPHGK